MKTFKKASKALISNLDSLKKECFQAFQILKKASPNYEEVFPEVNDEKAKIMKEHTKALQDNKSDDSDSKV